ncbi:hypothetical protein B0H34DRAFT_697379 [Crassisporium funariophilum]|nr:hypothetical protein B0H34DRAFT_697379 [Crassisporium funariophilum]
MAFAAMAVLLSPGIWLTPPVVALTFIYHTYILLIANSESYSTPHIYSTSCTVCAYILATLWTAVCAVATAFTCLLSSGRIESTDAQTKLWMILLSAFSLIEVFTLGYIAMNTHKIMKKISYSEKWRWRNGSSTTSEWSLEK